MIDTRQSRVDAEPSFNQKVERTPDDLAMLYRKDLVPLLNIHY